MILYMCNEYTGALAIYFFTFQSITYAFICVSKFTTTWTQFGLFSLSNDSTPVQDGFITLCHTTSERYFFPMSWIPIFALFDGSQNVSGVSHSPLASAHKRPQRWANSFNLLRFLLAQFVSLEPFFEIVENYLQNYETFNIFLSVFFSK